MRQDAKSRSGKDIVKVLGEARGLVKVYLSFNSWFVHTSFPAIYYIIKLVHWVTFITVVVGKFRELSTFQ